VVHSQEWCKSKIGRTTQQAVEVANRAQSCKLHIQLRDLASGYRVSSQRSCDKRMPADAHAQFGLAMERHNCACKSYRAAAMCASMEMPLGEPGTLSAHASCDKASWIHAQVERHNCKCKRDRAA